MSSNSRTEWGALGEINFTAAESPASMSVRQSTTFTEMPRINEKPLLQNVGDALNKIDLTFGFSVGWCVPDEQLKRLQDAMFDRLPLYLAWGSGRFNGYYVLTEIGTTVRETLPTGEVLSLNVSVSLLETLDRPEPVLVTTGSPFLSVRSA